MKTTKFYLGVGTFYEDEFERLFPDAYGSRNGMYYLITFPHPDNIKFTPYHYYTWNGLCRKMNIIPFIPKGLVNKWIKRYVHHRELYPVLKSICEYLGSEYKDLQNIWKEMERVDTAVYHVDALAETRNFIIDRIMERIKKNNTSIVYDQIRKILNLN